MSRPREHDGWRMLGARALARTLGALALALVVGAGCAEEEPLPDGAGKPADAAMPPADGLRAAAECAPACGPLTEPAPSGVYDGPSACYDGCNWCVCTAAGPSACTARLCDAGR